MYSGPQLVELLERQHQARQQSGLFKKDSFTLQWRAKVGSFPHPDIETIVSAGEPCGAWRPSDGHPEDKRNVGQNWKQMPKLPLNGYIPGSCIRGVVRAWAKQRPKIKLRMYQLLGYQDNDTISAGKIEFLDAWPEQPTKLTLDIVNPQEPFQVYHEGQSTPLSLYTLGNGKDSIRLTVAIRGIPGRTTKTEVEEVWGWVQQALSLYGVGSRTASGYGGVKLDNFDQPAPDPDYSVKQFDFSLYSQGCAGPDMKTLELRPSHWRGWLRSWMLRFLLGVMSKENAQITVTELMGTLESPADNKSRKGSVRLQMIQGEPWGELSQHQPNFYAWKGQLLLSARSNILNSIILPVVRFAVMVGGVGRGWRRPLHIYWMQKRNGEQEKASRGTYLTLTHELKSGVKPFGLPPQAENWRDFYQEWQTAVQQRWPNRFAPDAGLKAEVFSPLTCAVYLVPGPEAEPVERKNLTWKDIDAVETRGLGMDLIYNPTYKRQPDVGGDAGRGNAYCSWVSVRRIPVKQGTKELVCLFMGDENSLRAQFLGDLARIPDAVHLFGVRPN